MKLHSQNLLWKRKGLSLSDLDFAVRVDVERHYQQGSFSAFGDTALWGPAGTQPLRGTVLGRGVGSRVPTQRNQKALSLAFPRIDLFRVISNFRGLNTTRR